MCSDPAPSLRMVTPRPCNCVPPPSHPPSEQVLTTGKKRHLANLNTVLVCHGITIQIFFMRWFKYNVDEFMTYENPNNCEAAVFEWEWDSATKNYKLVFKYILLPDGTHENVRRKRTDAILKREIDLSKPLVRRARSKTRRMSTILSHIQQQGLGDRTQSHHAMHPVN